MARPKNPEPLEAKLSVRMSREEKAAMLALTKARNLSSMAALLRTSTLADVVKDYHELRQMFSKRGEEDEEDAADPEHPQLVEDEDDDDLDVDPAVRERVLT